MQRRQDFQNETTAVSKQGKCVIAHCDANLPNCMRQDNGTDWLKLLSVSADKRYEWWLLTKDQFQIDSHCPLGSSQRMISQSNYSKECLFDSNESDQTEVSSSDCLCGSVCGSQRKSSGLLAHTWLAKQVQGSHHLLSHLQTDSEYE